MLHLLSRRAWKDSQQLASGGAAPPPPPPPMPTYSKKRKRSPSPQPEPEPPVNKREKKGRPPKIKEEPEPEPELEPEEEEPEEDSFELPELALTARPSRNRRKSAKILQIEKESAGTSAEKDIPESPTNTGRKKGAKTPQIEESNVPDTPPASASRKKGPKTPQIEETPNVPDTPKSTGRKRGAKTPQVEESPNVPDTPTSTGRKKGAKTKQIEEPFTSDEKTVTPTSKSRRKSSKSAQIEEEATVVEKEKTTPSSSKRKSGKLKETEKEEKKKSGKKVEEIVVKKEKEDEGTSMTFTTGKGRKSKTTSIRIKPIVEPKKEPEEPEVVPEESQEGGVRGSSSQEGGVRSGSSHKKKKGKKHQQQQDLKVEIPTEPSITIKEESGIKLKLILSPKERSEAVEVKTEFEDASPVTEERRKGRKDKGKKGKKDKSKEESPDKIKAKLVFKDQVLSLDGDKVTHSEKSKSGSKSKKRKHGENIPDSPVAEQSHKKQKTSKRKSGELGEIVPDASHKLSDRKKKQLEIGDLVAKLEQRLSWPDDEDNDDEKSRTKSHKDKHRHKSKDRFKKGDELHSKKDKKSKKKSRHERYIHDAPETPPRNDLDIKLEELDSLEDTDMSLVIDENPSDSLIKKKSNKDGDRARHGSEGERTKDGEQRKDKSKHKHRKHLKHKKKHVQLVAKQIAEHMFTTPQGIEGSPITPNMDVRTPSSGGPSSTAAVGGSPPDMAVAKKSSSATKSKKTGKKDVGGDTPDGQKKPQKEKKPMSAYLLWTRETRPGVVAQNPGADFAAISRLMGAKWHQLTDKEKLYWKKMEKMQTSKHKNIPSLSAHKMSSKHAGKSRPKSPARMKSPDMEAIDIAAHLRLLGESLANVGGRLQEHKGEIEIHGSVSVLLDSTLCALGPLMALTSQVPEIDGCSRDTHVSTLENIAYIMPGL